MIGVVLNVAGILIGGSSRLARRKPLSAASGLTFKVILRAFAAFYGLRLSWISISGSAYEILKQVVIVIVSVMIRQVVG